jgi:hypothetical protein
MSSLNEDDQSIRSGSTLRFNTNLEYHISTLSQSDISIIFKRSIGYASSINLLHTRPIGFALIPRRKGRSEPILHVLRTLVSLYHRYRYWLPRLKCTTSQNRSMKEILGDSYSFWCSSAGIIMTSDYVMTKSTLDFFRYNFFKVYHLTKSYSIKPSRLNILVTYSSILPLQLLALLEFNRLRHIQVKTGWITIPDYIMS